MLLEWCQIGFKHELLLKGDKQNIINLLRNIYNYFFYKSCAAMLRSPGAKNTAENDIL